MSDFDKLSLDKLDFDKLSLDKLSLDKLDFDKLDFDKLSLDRVVLFDGVCNFCESSVQFIIKHDKTNSLKFASLQSKLGRELLIHYKMPTTLEGVVFIEDGKAYFKSAAAFKIARYFGGFWKILNIFSILPLAISDFFYDIIAKNRYKWFGKKESCMIPTPEVRSRFLDV